MIPGTLTPEENKKLNNRSHLGNKQNSSQAAHYNRKDETQTPHIPVTTTQTTNYNTTLTIQH